MDRSSPQKKKQGNPNLEQVGKGTRFSSTNQPINRRSRKIYTILKETGYSKDDIKATYNELAFYSDEDLQALLDNKEAPIITRITAKALQNALETGNYNQIKDILEQVLGKPNQPIENKQAPEETLDLNDIEDELRAINIEEKKIKATKGEKKNPSKK